MVNSGASAFFPYQSLSLAGRMLTEDKRGNSRKGGGGIRATSKLEKNSFKQGSLKTTSNTKGGEQVGAGLGSCVSVCAWMWMLASLCACMITWRKAAKMHPGYAASTQVEKTKRLSALIGRRWSVRVRVCVFVCFFSFWEASPEAREHFSTSAAKETIRGWPCSPHTRSRILTLLHQGSRHGSAHTNTQTTHMHFCSGYRRVDIDCFKWSIYNANAIPGAQSTPTHLSQWHTNALWTQTHTYVQTNSDTLKQTFLTFL